jgi:hypothetical protein
MGIAPEGTEVRSFAARVVRGALWAFVLGLSVSGCSSSEPVVLTSDEAASEGAYADGKNLVSVVSCSALIMNVGTPGATRREVFSLKFQRAGGKIVTGVVKLVGIDNEDRAGPVYETVGTKPIYLKKFPGKPLYFEKVGTPKLEFGIFPDEERVVVGFYGMRVEVRATDLLVVSATTFSALSHYYVARCAVTREQLRFEGAAPVYEGNVYQGK